LLQAANEKKLYKDLKEQMPSDLIKYSSEPDSDLDALKFAHYSVHTMPIKKNSFYVKEELEPL